MNKKLFSLTIFSLLLGLFAENLLAQASGTKPELFMYRHNGSMLSSPLPAVTGNTLGTIQWRGLTAINSIKLGATIKSIATSVAPGNLQANMFFATSDATGLSDKVVITPEGLVGIGELNPTFFKLHVKGNTHTTGRFHGRIHYDVGAPTGNPSTYIDESYFEQKPRSVLGTGLPANASYPIGGILSLAPGGGSLDRQLFSGGDDGFWTRSQNLLGADSWDTWYKFLTSEDISGHVGRVPRFTGITAGDPSSALHDSQLFDNGTNVSIGGNHPPTPPASIDASYLLTVNSLASGRAAIINGSTRLDGNVGINVAPNADPLIRLDVNGRSRLDGNVGIGTLPSATNRLEVLGASHLDGNLGLGVAPSATDRLDVSGTAMFRNDTRVNGILMVGAAIPAPPHPGVLEHELYVGGSIEAEEVVVKLIGSWPDYVLAEDYELKPLSEVEAFIQQEKHLPGLPSAAEVADNGIHLGEMQKTQMEKIEELYLHMIALEKRLNTLEAKNTQLESENAALKANLEKGKR